MIGRIGGHGLVIADIGDLRILLRHGEACEFDAGMKHRLEFSALAAGEQEQLQPSE